MCKNLPNTTYYLKTAYRMCLAISGGMSATAMDTKSDKMETNTLVLKCVTGFGVEFLIFEFDFYK